MNKYETIDKNRLKTFINSLPYEVEIFGISVAECAYHLKTSTYQVRKYMKQLESEGIVKTITVHDTCGCYALPHCECEATGLTYKKWVRVNRDEEVIRCTTCQATLSKWLLNGDRVEFCGYCGNEIEWSDEE